MLDDIARKFNIDITWYYVFFIYFIMVIYGMCDNAKSVVFPLIKLDLNLDDDIQGYLVGTSLYGYSVMCVLGLVIMPYTGIKKTFQLAFLLVIIGFYATILAPSYAYLFPSLFTIWMGFGTLDIALHSLASAIFTTNSAIKYTVMHFFFGFGAIVGPFIVGGMKNYMNESYRSVYYFLLYLVLILFGYASFSSFEIAQVENSESVMNIKTSIKDPMVWFVGFILGLMEICELGVVNWSGLYFHDVYGMDVTKEGAWFSSAYYATFTCGRLFLGYFVEKLGYMRSLYLCSITTIIVMIVSFVIGRNGIYLLLFVGLPIGLNWPTIMSVGVKIWKEKAPINSCFIIFLNSFINSLSQVIIGYLNKYIGPGWGFRSLVVYVFITLICLIILNRYVGKTLDEAHQEEIRMKKERKEKEEASNNVNQSLLTGQI